MKRQPVGHEKATCKVFRKNNHNTPAPKTFSISNLRSHIKKLKKLARKHDHVDADGNYRIEPGTFKFLCFKHKRFE